MTAALMIACRIVAGAVALLALLVAVEIGRRHAMSAQAFWSLWLASIVSAFGLWAAVTRT
ncbi:hypothetical protein [Roseospira goensis]|uniref:FtsH-binding integral membrane protein n=1 Tax=Roseospira goensis TaxID=391922 RepID=A0A7W6S2T7_9PROT|nr:hypothetical protein [Roseospira goensis]MBB4287722.1 FtsH-binding integral membrane protein [Roseospira goensis]